MSRAYDPSQLKTPGRVHRHYVQEAVGDGATTVFHLTHTPLDDGYLLVYVDGVRKAPTLNAAAAHDYSLKGTTVTFAVAPANTKVILFNIAGA